MVLVLFWDWWTTRNKKSAEGKERTVEETCHMIQRHWVDFQIKPGGESKGTISNITTAKLEDRWSKPQENWVKVNFDAAFRAESRIGAWGYIARSDDGDCIGAAAGKLWYIRDPLQAEAEAGLAAVEGAVAMGLNRVVFESDSKNLVSALRDKKHDLSVIGVLLKEMRSLCIVSFQSFKFQFVSRKYNGVAHSLAQYGLRADGDYTDWEGETPNLVSDLVASEMAGHSG
jgi:ribonuclease HI